MKPKTMSQALAIATRRYMRAVARSAEKKVLRHIILNAMSMPIIKTDVELVESLFVNEKGNYGRNKAGLVKFVNFDKLKESIKTVARTDIEGFLKEVYDLSQKYVPLDKRYKNKRNISKLESSVNRRILRLDSEYSKKAYFRYAGFDNDDRYSQNELYEAGFDFVRMRRKRGWYEKQEVDYINSMLRSSNNKRKTISRVFWNGKTLQERQKRTDNLFDTGFKLRKKPLSFADTFEGAVVDLHKKGIKITTRQPSGGYQELKHGGRIVGLSTGDLNKYGITYSAFDKSRKFSTFNYAALQHENLAFKHARGKKPLFLKKALDKVLQTYKGENR